MKIIWRWLSLIQPKPSDSPFGEFHFEGSKGLLANTNEFLLASSELDPLIRQVCKLHQRVQENGWRLWPLYLMPDTAIISPGLFQKFLNVFVVDWLLVWLNLSDLTVDICLFGLLLFRLALSETVSLQLLVCPRIFILKCFELLQDLLQLLVFVRHFLNSI